MSQHTGGSADADTSTVTLRPDELPGLIGQEVGVSRWFEAGPDRIAGFTCAIFGDADAGGAGLDAGPEEAPGFLILSLLGAMSRGAVPRLQGSTMGINYGFDNIRFLDPVRVGERIRGRFYLSGLEQKTPGRLRLTHRIKVEVEGRENPAILADWVSLRLLTPEGSPP